VGGGWKLISEKSAEILVNGDRASSLKRMATTRRRAFPMCRATAEPQSEDSSGLPVRGQVKWFNASKGTGSSSSLTGREISSSATALRYRLSTLTGETLEMRVASGAWPPGGRSDQRGQQPASSAISTSLDRHQTDGLGGERSEMGTVKWYNARRGSAVVRDSGGRDVFVHASALQRAVSQV
jgi:cold shock CspA family protein